MAEVEVTRQREIPADANAVFAALADYRGTRERLLTDHYSEYEVREGGTGAGTLVHWKLQATSKRVRDCLLEVTEPTEGQLTERDRNSSMVTTWTVTPGAAPGGSRVTIPTTWQGAGGVGGFFERTFAPKGLGRIHDAVLANLETVVRDRAA